MLIEVTHSPLIVLGSVAVAIIGAFTSLRLTSNLRDLSIEVRKRRVSQGAIALGTSIWSMHFIAMLGFKLPVAISYDPARTLASALIAVLVVGMAFLSLHFGVRTRKTILIAGILTGIGIAGMHYLGMSAISENVTITYQNSGIFLAIGIGIFASVAALELAYGDRSLLSIAIGSIVLGLAISAIHHTAMYFTEFYKVEGVINLSPSFLDNDQLALIVMLSSFMLCGMFLLLAVPAETAGQASSNALLSPHGGTATSDTVMSEPQTALPATGAAPSDEGSTSNKKPVKIPYEQNNVVKFLSVDDIHAVKADGHYTCIYNGIDKLFCPWSISHVADALDSEKFIRTHRSFLVNRHRIVGLRRDGDKSYCVIGSDTEFEIPVARPNVTELRKILQSS